MSIKHIAFFTSIIVALFVINGLIHSIYATWQKQHVALQARQELEKERQENKLLKEKLKIVSQPQFVEEEARNKLFLAKPGESVIVFSPDVLRASQSARPKPQDLRPNWKKWWELFF